MSNNSTINSIRFFQWLKEARPVLEGMVPHDSRNINEKLVHLKDIKCYKKDLNQLEKSIAIMGHSNPELLFKAQSLHDTVLTSLHSIYKSTYNHRSDKIVDLFHILYHIEVHIGCSHRLADSNVTRWSAPPLYSDNGRMILPIARKVAPKGEVPTAQGTAKRRVGVSYIR
ncbi:hypothetical protein ACNSPD_01150 [Yersinia enterocolitica]|uniref:hypothetical protein n=1 Tax=Yersinia enterocolitica TaxID=630 RepID=UPI003AB90E9A